MLPRNLNSNPKRISSQRGPRNPAFTFYVGKRRPGSPGIGLYALSLDNERLLCDRYLILLPMLPRNPNPKPTFTFYIGARRLASPGIGL